MSQPLRVPPRLLQEDEYLAHLQSQALTIADANAREVCIRLIELVSEMLPVTRPIHGSPYDLRNVRLK